MVPIVYGYPGDGLLEAAARGEVVLGGCVIMPHQPRWKCLSCKETSGGRDCWAIRSAMSWFTSMWRVWLGVAVVVFFGVPVLSVVSWMVGGFLRSSNDKDHLAEIREGDR